MTHAGPAQVGLIGVGEAGAAIGAGLREGGAVVTGFDARADDPAVRARAEAAGLPLAGSVAELVEHSQVLLCLTTAKTALLVARDCAPHLAKAHLYVDCNSASPQLKRELAEVIGDSFTDAAIMAAVPPRRHQTPMLLSGPGAQGLVAAVDGLGMDLTVLGPEPGQASAVKMFRSLLVKGLEALLLECAAGAQAYGVTEQVLGSMPGGLPMHDWNQLAAYLMTRTLAHGERRAEELRQVAGTLTECGVEPLLADAGARRLQWLADLALPDGSASADYLQVLNALRETLKSPQP